MIIFSILILLFAAFWDIRTLTVPNWLLFPAILVVVLFSLHGDTFIGGAVGFALLALPAVILRGSIGAGDVKLSLLIGLMVGWPMVVFAVPLGVMVGCLYGAIRYKSLKESFAFAPFLSLGAIVLLILKGVGK